MRCASKRFSSLSIITCDCTQETLKATAVVRQFPGTWSCRIGRSIFQIPANVDRDVRVRTVFEKSWDDANHNASTGKAMRRQSGEGECHSCQQEGSNLTLILCTALRFQPVAHVHSLHNCEHMVSLLHRPFEGHQEKRHDHKHGRQLRVYSSLLRRPPRGTRRA